MAARFPYLPVAFGRGWTDVPKEHDFSFWQEYPGFCRDVAQDCGVSIRTLDRALWQFSKENQR